MGLLSSLKSMFSSESTASTAKEYPVEEYQGFFITPAPQQEGGQYRVNGTIRKGEQVHQFVRADMLPSEEACAEEMLRKAKQMIDQQGDRIF